ncbi:MAG TPA: fumarylacetoacetate hydrolase family protein [Propionibacteriaceae bacterium]|nr:fumarylacetoacetate hydrolase family protein [Propionibacteriaceae bacterium]
MNGPEQQLVRLDLGGEVRWAVRTAAGDAPLRIGLDDLLRGPLAEAQAAVNAAGTAADLDGTLLPPLDSQEVWAAGVTYERSRTGRMEESTEAGIYDRVYVARRPEVFFKATAPRVVGDGAPVGVRADSPWNAPEAELGLVLNAAGEVFGYVVGNDVSSRSIEGENPLYLPQAKVYDRACALGSAIVPVWAAAAPPFDISCQVRRGDAVAFSGSTSTASLTRSFEDLAGWLMAALTFPVGVVLLTGTGIVPDESFTLRAGDVVTIDIPGIGTLTNPVVLVGRDLDQEQG